MGGMLLHQTRNVGQRYTCTGRFQRFIVACTVSGTVYSNGTALSATDTAAVLLGDTQSLASGADLPPFGVDPVFLTGSAFYDPGLLGQIGERLRSCRWLLPSRLSSLLSRLARPPVLANMNHLLAYHHILATLTPCRRQQCCFGQECLAYSAGCCQSLFCSPALLLWCARKLRGGCSG